MFLCLCLISFWVDKLHKWKLLAYDKWKKALWIISYKRKGFAEKTNLQKLCEVACVSSPGQVMWRCVWFPFILYTYTRSNTLTPFLPRLLDAEREREGEKYPHAPLFYPFNHVTMPTNPLYTWANKQLPYRKKKGARFAICLVHVHSPVRSMSYWVGPQLLPSGGFFFYSKFSPPPIHSHLSW